MCKFERVFRQNKAENRRLAGGKSRFDNVVLTAVAPLPLAGATSPRWNPEDSRGAAADPQ
jgi:hypothetical protein